MLLANLGEMIEQNGLVLQLQCQLEGSDMLEKRIRLMDDGGFAITGSDS